MRGGRESRGGRDAAEDKECRVLGCEHQPERSWGGLRARAGDRWEMQSSRHLLHSLEGCRYQERKGSRRRRRQREREVEGREEGLG